MAPKAQPPRNNVVASVAFRSVPSVSERLAASASLAQTDVVAALLKLEKRSLPAVQEVGQLHIKATRCACFDTSMLHGWVAHRICERCVLLNGLLTASAAAGNQSSTYSTLAHLAVLNTDCISETVDSSGEPLQDEQGASQTSRTLPIELWSHVARYANAERIRGALSDREYVPTLETLLATSSFARYQVLEVMGPIALYEFDSGHSSLRVHSVLTQYVPEALAYWLLDATSKKHKLRTPTVPACKDAIWTSSEHKATAVAFTIIIDTQARATLPHQERLPSKRLSLGPWQSIPSARESYTASVKASEGRHISVTHACRLLRQASSPRITHPVSQRPRLDSHGSQCTWTGRQRKDLVLQHKPVPLV